ncbi:MAG: CDP-2,3-bis-(O-geranylgeranyl)-sn-glycerol synthase [Candidatus Helarchaeota archaeon]
MSDDKPTSNSEISKEDIRNVLIFTLILAALNLIYFFYIWFEFTILDYIVIIGIGVLAVAPAYLANAGMALVGGGKPIDGGRFFWDGERIFGDGKTIKGFWGGTLVGTVGGLILLLINPAIAYYAKSQILPPFPWIQSLKLVTPDEVFAILGYDLFRNFDPIIFLRIPLLAVGAPIGDLLGSFLKRRTKVKRGGQFPILDQLDFILVSIAISYPLLWLKLHYILILCLLTPLIALLGNWVAYKMGKKSVPW